MVMTGRRSCSSNLTVSRIGFIFFKFWSQNAENPTEKVESIWTVKNPTGKR